MLLTKERFYMSEKNVKKLKFAVKGSGLTQAQLAKKLDISRQSINDWLNKRNIPDNLLSKICDIIGRDPEEFLIKKGIENIEDDTDLVELSFFAYYSHRDKEIKYSNETETISKERYGIEHMTNEEIRERYFIYQINKNLSDILRKGGLIIFEKFDKPLTSLEELREYIESPTVKIVLLDTGEILRFKDGYIFTVDREYSIPPDELCVIAIGRNILRVGI